MDYVTDKTANKGVSVSKHLIISVNGFHYAVKVPFIHKIVALSHISFLPHVEPYILGTTKADNEIYTVLDLRVLFGKKPEASQRPMVAVLLVYGTAKICAVVDGIISVIDLDTECASYPWTRSHYISGIIQTDNTVINILSVNKLVSFDCKL